MDRKETKKVVGQAILAKYGYGETMNEIDNLIGKNVTIVKNNTPVLFRVNGVLQTLNNGYYITFVNNGFPCFVGFPKEEIKDVDDYNCVITLKD